jgi:Tfp pilus assembly protein PilV
MMLEEGTKARRHQGTKGKRRRCARGVTFTEVMFAVILLGIGFIMVAAIFPVAIQQSQANLEDATGIVVARQGSSMMQHMGSVLRVPNTGTVPQTYEWKVNVDTLAPGTLQTPLRRFVAAVATVPMNDTKSTVQYAAISVLMGNFISMSDSRYAWVPVAYQCEVPTAGQTPSSMKVWLLAMKIRNQTQYTPGIPGDLNVVTIGGAPYGTFVPRVEHFYLTEGDANPDTLTFVDSSGSKNDCSTPVDVPEAAEGAYVWVANDQMAGPMTVAGMATVYPGQAIGRFYRLGVKRDDVGPGVWELAPGDGPGHSMGLQWLAGPNDVLGTPPPDGDDIQINENIPPRKVGTPVTGGEMPAVGFIVGKGYIDPNNPASGYEGAAQDLMALSPVTVPLR